MMVQNVLNCCQNMDHINSMSARVIKVFVSKTGKVKEGFLHCNFGTQEVSESTCCR